MTENQPRGGFGINWWGIAFVVVGVWWLLGELGYVRFTWSVAGPLAIIILGLSMVFGGMRRRARWEWWMQNRGGWKHRADCTCSCSCCTEARASP